MSQSWSLQSFYHTVLNVSDLDASIAFYRRLGFEVLEERRGLKWPDFVAKNFGMKKAQGISALLSVPGDDNATMLDLIQWIEPEVEAPRNAPVPRIIALRVKNIAEAYQALVGEGVVFTNELTGPFEDLGVIGVACCYDPDGTIVELMELAPGLRHSQTQSLPQTDG